MLNLLSSAVQLFMKPKPKIPYFKSFMNGNWTLDLTHPEIKFEAPKVYFLNMAHENNITTATLYKDPTHEKEIDSLSLEFPSNTSVKINYKEESALAFLTFNQSFVSQGSFGNYSYKFYMENYTSVLITLINQETKKEVLLSCRRTDIAQKSKISKLMPVSTVVFIVVNLIISGKEFKKQAKEESEKKKAAKSTKKVKKFKQGKKPLKKNIKTETQKKETPSKKEETEGKIE